VPRSAFSNPWKTKCAATLWLNELLESLKTLEDEINALEPIA